MTDIALGLAFARYLANPCTKTIDAVLVALEARTDLPISIEETRKALTDGIAQVKALTASTPSAKASNLMQRLLSKGIK
ncbi:hypothetical protein [Variovorax sp.]|uniref:hypothetical protein n=1 Tax=Variovorax sp. TaxID=1871043 RepID=UPI003BA96D63